MLHLIPAKQYTVCEYSLKYNYEIVYCTSCFIYWDNIICNILILFNEVKNVF